MITEQLIKVKISFKNYFKNNKQLFDLYPGTRQLKCIVEISGNNYIVFSLNAMSSFASWLCVYVSNI